MRQPLNISRRSLLATGVAALAAASPFGVRAQAAQAYPSAPITLYVQAAPGGTADLTARALGQQLTESLGIAVVIMNEPSAGGVIALRKAGQAKPDGYTAMLLGTKTAVSAALQKGDSYNALLKQVVPVAVTSSSDVALVVGANSKYTRLADLVNDIKASPGKMTIGVGDVHGGIQHLFAELLKLEMRGDYVIVPYKTAAAVTVAVQAGEVNAAIELLPGVMGSIRGGVIRALAVTGRKAYPELKNASTFHDAGFPGTGEVVASSYVVVPVGTPVPVIAKLNKDVNKALGEPKLRASSEARGARVASGLSPAQAAEQFSRELAKWREIVQRTKVSVD
jgi:tripartite-type tricarboxylate transporter receptor subunit TctC